MRRGLSANLLSFSAEFQRALACRLGVPDSLHFGCALCRRLANNPDMVHHLGHAKECPLRVEGKGPLAARMRGLPMELGPVLGPVA